ncbi:hypothetical protein KFL_007380020 [Klebsormidium nitens]|uniref:SCP domain-containing protein n=1 Tax=Klebsormidium nitens TaxID=105231 RepID=A0A1Y1IRA7_KLENI|nr:hypothetical protein KFL_007380020 [Klebsormidium nitens]|eukprot:GAQ91167.1 hypothetical protein KFL_007380020 [Klebsormidium nitens]
MSLNQAQVLARINDIRRRHGAPALVWDDALARCAQDWANRKQFVHSTDRQYGENLAKVWSFEPDMRTAIDWWAKEMDLYDYERPGFNNKTGHGTQIVWKNTRKIGADDGVLDKALNNPPDPAAHCIIELTVDAHHTGHSGKSPELAVPQTFHCISRRVDVAAGLANKGT